jgi:hypothetical protein
VLYDGAGVAGRMDHQDPDLAPSVRQAVVALLDAALAPGEDRFSPPI